MNKIQRLTIIQWQWNDCLGNETKAFSGSCQIYLTQHCPSGIDKKNVG